VSLASDSENMNSDDDGGNDDMEFKNVKNSFNATPSTSSPQGEERPSLLNRKSSARKNDTLNDSSYEPPKART
jgi:hypothetical protein